MNNKADKMFELLKPILFLLGILLMNVAVYQFSIPLGLLATGASLVGIALIIDFETRGSF
ncbi:hypothetical protein [Planococcus dechangensis]|uniref:DUF1056 family protein n=1 Tax=Planococcus dechangensis TaxID=1176255 RepID=A0ABV9MG74_9BACL